MMDDFGIFAATSETTASNSGIFSTTSATTASNSGIFASSVSVTVSRDLFSSTATPDAFSNTLFGGDKFKSQISSEALASADNWSNRHTQPLDTWDGTGNARRAHVEFNHFIMIGLGIFLETVSF